MKFPSIENAISSWKLRKGEISALGFNATQLAEIENLVLRAIVLLMVSEYEDYIEKLFIKRAEKTNDKHIHSIFEKYMDTKFRSPDLGKMNQMLGQMGGTYRQTFRDRVEVNNPHLNSLLKYPIERRVGARGLHYFLGNHGSCRPGALTGRVFQQAVKASWDSIMVARHAIVHKDNAGVINLTWQDLNDAVIKTGLVLEALGDPLQLTSVDLQNL